MRINIGKRGMMYLAGGAAVAALVAFSCGKVTESTVPPAVVEDIDSGETDNKTYTVVASGFGVSVAEGLTQTIADGSPAVFTLTLEPI